MHFSCSRCGTKAIIQVVSRQATTHAYSLAFDCNAIIVWENKLNHVDHYLLVLTNWLENRLPTARGSIPTRGRAVFLRDNSQSSWGVLLASYSIVPQLRYDHQKMVMVRSCLSVIPNVYGNNGLSSRTSFFHPHFLVYGDLPVLDGPW
jgi:hypothetical protein